MKKLRQVFAETMHEIGSRDRNMIVMVGDISRKMKGTACRVNNEWELKELYR